MSPLSGLIVLLAVIVVVQGQLALPTPTKSTKIATLQVGLSVTSGVSIQHLPDSDNIVVVWLDMEASYTNATARGAIVSTNGEVKATFPVSESNTILSIATPAQIVPISSNNFTVVFTTIYGGVFVIRSFNSSGQPLTDSIFVNFETVLISMNAVYDEGTGDLFIVGADGLATGNQIVVARLSLTGEVLDAAVFQTAATNVAPTIAVSGDSVAFSVAVVNADSGEANLQVFVANINDLTNATTFFPYGEGASSTVAQQVIADPLNENTFVVISSTGLVVDSALATTIAATRFNRENSSIAQTLVDYSGLTLSISTSLYNNKGVLIVTTFTNPSYVLYPIEITSDTPLQLDTDQLAVLHAITAAEKGFDTYKDMRTATTTWSTGSAAVWTEISANTAAFSIVTKIFGTYCGDNLAEGNETCDGGASCNADCTCPNSLVADGNNGCGNAPVGTPSTPTSGTRPISVAPVTNTPNASTSDAANTMTATTITVSAVLMLVAATLF